MVLSAAAKKIEDGEAERANHRALHHCSRWGPQLLSIITDACNTNRGGGRLNGGPWDNVHLRQVRSWHQGDLLKESCCGLELFKAIRRFQCFGVAYIFQYLVCRQKLIALIGCRTILESFRNSVVIITINVYLKYLLAQA